MSLNIDWWGDQLFLQGVGIFAKSLQSIRPPFEMALSQNILSSFQPIPFSWNRQDTVVAKYVIFYL